MVFSRKNTRRGDKNKAQRPKNGTKSIYNKASPKQMSKLSRSKSDSYLLCSSNASQDASIFDRSNASQHSNPSDVQPVMWSLGSEHHETGNCRPCAWHSRPAGCYKGVGCTFCHTCDKTVVKRNRQKRLKEKKYRLAGKFQMDRYDQQI